MPAAGKLYIDPEGVKRGYYVYVHKDRATGEVFYVGKGSGRRAWTVAGRHDTWKEKVASLANRWDVEIVQQDLSEIEASELEAQLVERYGGCAADGGTLANWMPGGEDPASVGLTIQFDDGGWSTAYYAARQFKTMSRKEQEMIAASVRSALEPLAAQLSDFEAEGDESDDDKLSDSASDVESIIDGVLEATSDLMRRRVSWKDFGLRIEEAVDDLESGVQQADQCHPRVIPLLQHAFMAAREIFDRIDSGNRQAAEELADETASGK